MELRMLGGYPRRVNCHLCVDKPAPKDLKHHIMFYHMVENDIAVEKIFWMHFSSEATTQTTVTWTDEFSYYDQRTEATEAKEASKTLEIKFHRKRRRKNPSGDPSVNTRELREIACDEIKKVEYPEKKFAVDAQDLGAYGNNEEMAFTTTTIEGFDPEECIEINGKETEKHEEVSEEITLTTSVEGVVKDFYDYGDEVTEESPPMDENNGSLCSHQMNKESLIEVNQADLSSVLDDEESPSSVNESNFQEVVKKFGNSISIINIKNTKTNGFSSVHNSHEALNEMGFDSESRAADEADEDVGLKHITNISVEVEDLERIKRKEKLDELDIKKTKTETLKVDNVQTVAEKLGISVSISVSDQASPERSSTNNTEEIKTKQSQTTAWCLETLLGNGAISVAKFVPEENAKEDVKSLDSMEINGISIESEKEKTVEDHTDTTFLSSDEENSYESESPLDRLVNSGLLSINKIEEPSKKNDEDLEQTFTDDDCIRYACPFCEFVCFRKDVMEEHIFQVHEVAGRPLKQIMIVKMVKTFIPPDDTEVEEGEADVGAIKTDSITSIEDNGSERFGKSNEMEEEAFNSDEEFDDDDDENFDYY